MAAGGVLEPSMDALQTKRAPMPDGSATRLQGIWRTARALVGETEMVIEVAMCH
jgi:hypothetical protein